METINLSVVLCTYNDGDYLKESIQSVLDQTYPHFELIVVIDGSTDDSINVVKSFTDKRLRVFYKPNSGLPDSLNYGIQRAKYEWIVRMDGDDICLPDRFENQVKLLKDDIAVVGGQCLLIDGQGMHTGKLKLPLDSKNIKGSLLRGVNPIVHPCTIINRKYLKKCGGYDTNFKNAQDYDLWLMILGVNSSMINSDKYVLKLRKHGNNISIKKRNMQSRYGIIAILKYKCHIHRQLTVEEFDAISKILDNSSVCKKYFDMSAKVVQITDIPKKVLNVIILLTRKFICKKYCSVVKRILTQ